MRYAIQIEGTLDGLFFQPDGIPVAVLKVVVEPISEPRTVRVDIPWEQLESLRELRIRCRSGRYPLLLRFSWDIHGLEVVDPRQPEPYVLRCDHNGWTWGTV